MAYKRILTIQDISCVGQCSMTVAMPILSVCGHETCILPTAVLSTHTGGFGRPELVSLENRMSDIWHHWNQNGIDFDAILVGYLGSEAAIDACEEILDHLLAKDGVVIVDPAFGDHGRIYSGLSEKYAMAMKRLCDRADVIIPNITEAAFFSGTDYQEQLDEEYVLSLLEKLNHPCVILTGVGYQKDETGILVWERGTASHYFHRKIDRNFHGTGDMFAACFTGAWLQGKTKLEAVQIAANFITHSLQNTINDPVHWYGVKFETAFPELIRMIFA